MSTKKKWAHIMPLLLEKRLNKEQITCLARLFLSLKNVPPQETHLPTVVYDAELLLSFRPPLGIVFDSVEDYQKFRSYLTFMLNYHQMFFYIHLKEVEIIIEKTRRDKHSYSLIGVRIKKYFPPETGFDENFWKDLNLLDDLFDRNIDTYIMDLMHIIEYEQVCLFPYKMTKSLFSLIEPVLNESFQSKDDAFTQLSDRLLDGFSVFLQDLFDTKMVDDHVLVDFFMVLTQQGDEEELMDARFRFYYDQPDIARLICEYIVLLEDRAEKIKKAKKKQKKKKSKKRRSEKKQEPGLGMEDQASSPPAARPQEITLGRKMQQTIKQNPLGEPKKWIQPRVAKSCAKKQQEEQKQEEQKKKAIKDALRATKQQKQRLKRESKRDQREKRALQKKEKEFYHFLLKNPSFFRYLRMEKVTQPILLSAYQEVRKAHEPGTVRPHNMTRYRFKLFLDNLKRMDPESVHMPLFLSQHDAFSETFPDIFYDPLIIPPLISILKENGKQEKMHTYINHFPLSGERSDILHKAWVLFKVLGHDDRKRLLEKIIYSDHVSLENLLESVHTTRPHRAPFLQSFARDPPDRDDYTMEDIVSVFSGELMDQVKQGQETVINPTQLEKIEKPVRDLIISGTGSHSLLYRVRPVILQKTPFEDLIETTIQPIQKTLSEQTQKHPESTRKLLRESYEIRSILKRVMERFFRLTHVLYHRFGILLVVKGGKAVQIHTGIPSIDFDICIVGIGRFKENVRQHIAELIARFLSKTYYKNDNCTLRFERHKEYMVKVFTIYVCYDISHVQHKLTLLDINFDDCQELSSRDIHLLEWDGKYAIAYLSLSSYVREQDRVLRDTRALDYKKLNYYRQKTLEKLTLIFEQMITQQT